eukprot:9367445-Alexandrium_andersonii.AAC.1
MLPGGRAESEAEVGGPAGDLDPDQSGHALLDVLAEELGLGLGPRGEDHDDALGDLEFEPCNGLGKGRDL